MKIFLLFYAQRLAFKIIFRAKPYSVASTGRMRNNLIKLRCPTILIIANCIYCFKLCTQAHTL